MATYYGTVKGEYEEVASSMDWPISCYQEAVRQYIQDSATSGASQTTSGLFQSVETLCDALEGTSPPAADTSPLVNRHPNPQLLVADWMWWSPRIFQHRANHTTHHHLFPLHQSHPHQRRTLPVTASLLTDSVIWPLLYVRVSRIWDLFF